MSLDSLMLVVNNYIGYDNIHILNLVQTKLSALFFTFEKLFGKIWAYCHQKACICDSRIVFIRHEMFERFVPLINKWQLDLLEIFHIDRNIGFYQTTFYSKRYYNNKIGFLMQESGCL